VGVDIQLLNKMITRLLTCLSTTRAVKWNASVRADKSTRCPSGARFLPRTRAAILSKVAEGEVSQKKVLGKNSRRTKMPERGAVHHWPRDTNGGERSTGRAMRRVGSAALAA